MRALSLWQPWASSLALGAKTVETRSWPTRYRGDIVIHASKRREIGQLLYYLSCWNWCGALAPMGVRMGVSGKLDLLPFGAFIAVAELVECRRTDSFTVGELDRARGPEFYRWSERQMGDFTPGRWGWVLRKVRRLRDPLPARGRQGLWSLPADQIEAVREQLVVAA